jgi:nickel/cobalt exporter
MNDLDKLQVLLPHWIEHQTEHADELRTWAERIQLTGREDVAERLLVAAAALQQAGDQLSDLLNQVGEMVETGEKT